MKYSEDSGAESSLDSDTVGHSTALGRAVWSRWIAPAGLAIGVVALALTLVQWFDPSSQGNGSPSFSDQQIKEAKTSVCAAYTTVHRAVVVNTHLEPSPNGDSLAVATSARLALYGGGSYLRDHLARAPATPADLAKAVDSLATTLEDLAVNYLADVPGFVQDQLRRNLDGQLVDVDGRCK
ncbi:MAG: hypothetical protein WBV80_10295 [Mycobacterium sp.]